MNQPELNKRRLRRSMLYVPADNLRALEKSLSLAADCIVYDLEDAVAPEKKSEARENLRNHFSAHPDFAKETAIRINGLDTEWAERDIECVGLCRPDAVVLPKVGSAQNVRDIATSLDAADASKMIKIFAMIESAQGVLNVAEIARLGKEKHARLSCLILGINDLVKETRIAASDARQIAQSWIMQIVLSARAGGLDAIDAVYNDFRDPDGFGIECRAGRAMGFDGKSVIHPAQIQSANEIFGPSKEELTEAQAIVDAFAMPENSSKGVIQLDGKMVERLHLHQAELLLESAALAGSSLIA